MGGLEFCIFTSALLLLSISAAVKCASSGSGDEPMYMKVFSTHQHWEGNYMYSSELYYCYLYVHSEHHLRKGGLLATFKDIDGATIELEGESVGQSELKIKFTVNTMFHNVNRFPLNFTMQGMLSQDSYSKIWSYTAHVLVPNTGIFGTIAFQQSDATFGPDVNKDPKAWKYAVIIGIPVILAVVGVAGTIAIVYWAIKKGYIRHVPKSYDAFNNPVRYENEGGNVHI